MSFRPFAAIEGPAYILDCFIYPIEASVQISNLNSPLLMLALETGLEIEWESAR